MGDNDKPYITVTILTILLVIVISFWAGYTYSSTRNKFNLNDYTSCLIQKKESVKSGSEFSGGSLV